MLQAFTAATLLALAAKVTSVIKYATAGQWRDVATQLVTWVVTVAALLIGAQAEVAQGIVIWGERTLADLDVWSLILVGLSIGSGASFAYDFKKAIDGTDSASEPPLTGPKAS